MSAAIWFRGDFSCFHRRHIFDVRCFEGSCPHVRRITTTYVLPVPHGSDGDRRTCNPNLRRRLRPCTVTNGGTIPTKCDEMLPLLKHGGVRSTLCGSANALFATGKDTHGDQYIYIKYIYIYILYIYKTKPLPPLSRDSTCTLLSKGCSLF